MTGSVHRSVSPSNLHIPGYHFTTFTTSGSAYCENVDIVFGYRISDKKPVVAKYSTSSFRLEREYYIMKKLYQYEDGPLYIVRPLEYINLSSGLTIAVYDGSETTTPLAQKESSPRFSTRFKKDYNDDHILHGSLYGDFGAFLRFAIKCTDCLEFYQKHDVIHGEIRSSSFQWNGADDAGVKLWNFGSGTKSLENYLTTEGWRKAANNKESMGKLQNSLVYVSPEKTGRTTYTPDHRSDIYSLGIVFFVLLTGQNPFDGGPLEIVNCILSRKIPLVHEIKLEVPEAISRIIEKMTNKAPDERYNSANGVRSDLEHCLKLLKTSQQSSTESIPLFPLGQHDVASVFTLPKMIYGRQDALSEMLFMIERCADLYKTLPLRSNNRVIRTHPPAHPPVPHGGSSGNSTDAMSDLSETCSNPDIGNKSTASPSFYGGGLDESDTSSVGSRLIVSNVKTSTHIVGVYGPGGIGKSALFTAVQPMARQNGYVAITKFDSRNKVPYGAVVRSLSQVLQQIISEEEEEVKLFYEHLKASLGPQFCNIGLMADNFVPELKPLLDSDTSTTSNNLAAPVIQMDDIEARTRFHNLYVEVFRAITHWKMTTLFLDDLHQADEPSLELIESLIMSRVPLLIFISYRDQEVTTKLAELLESKIANVHFIRIEALSMDPLVDFICDTLHRPRDTNRDAILPLAEIIFKRTRGNAFYVAQLLRTLERKKLIFFDWGKNEWNYDLREIEEATMLHNNNDSFDSQQLDFMVARLRELPHSGREILKWASFVGDVFSWNIIRNLITQNNDDDASTNTTFSDYTIVEENDSNDALSWSRRASRTNLHSSMDATSTTAHSVSSKLDSRDPMTGLQAVLHEGYIVAIGSDEFKWSHDRISQAAAELANPEARAKIHLKIAQYMMEEENVDTFLVADHLLKCFDLLISLESKEQYRKLLIEAGNKGRSSGAHGMAFAYYMCAIQLGDPGTGWAGDDDEYKATLALHTNAVALSWAVGEYGKTEELLEVIFANSRAPSDRIHAYRVQARYYFGCQLHSKGRETLFRCMDELGDERHRLDTSDQALTSLFSEIEELVEMLGEEAILQLPGCDNPSLIGTLGVMEELLTLSYWSGKKREMYYWACRILKLSFTKGPVGGTGNACMFAGLGYTNMCKKYTFAERLGNLGISLANKHGSSQEKGRAYSLYPAFLILWKHHHRESFQYFRTGMEFSLSAGDRIYVAFHQVHISTLMFYNGYNLHDTLQDAEASFADIHAWSTSIDMNSFAMCIIRAAKALQGHTYIDTPNVFDGDDGFNDAHFLEESCKQSSNPELVLNWYESFKIVPLTLYGHVDSAIEVGYRCFKTIDGHPCHRHTRMMLNYFSLSLIEKCRQDPLLKDKLMEQVRMNQELVHEWAVHSSINYAMYWTLIEAELAAFGDTPDILRAGRLYEQAIKQAREGSWYLELCVIHEYAGAFYERVGFFNIAYGFIKKAVDMYLSHGSYGKARHLSSKFGSLLSEYSDNKAEIHEAGVQTDPLPYHGTPPPATWSTSSLEEPIAHSNDVAGINAPYTCESIPPTTAEQTLMTLDIVDMASILKSSQVMSSEVKFDELLTSMMNIILENSGAECGAIIVKDGKYGLCAYGSQSADSVVTYDPPKPLSKTDHLVSSKIVNHTIHTRESIFIPNVKEDTRFAVGPWFDRTGDKSVICMPIIHKCTIVGCLLIEGTPGIFTQRHITVLSLLCQQMGISITNAFLFKSVQRVTMANMRMIEMQKQALEEARRSKEAADRATRLREIFLANMSHEIRTPFSGFYGMISLLAETKLDSEQYDLVKTAKESCEMLLRLIDDLLNFSKLQAGKVSLDLSPVVIEDAIADVTEMLIAMAIQKRINITYSIASDVPPVVMADGNRLRQIIINLLGNAIKFTHEGQIKIRCSIDKENTSEEDGHLSLLFEVIDSGIGISNEQRKALFAPFSQVDGSTTRKYGGTGLGLSICLQLVELMSGKIDVKSEPSKGSNFYFTMSTTPVPDESDKQKTTITNLLSQVSGTRILVADKHMSTVDMLRHTLPGTTVHGVCSIQELLSCQATDYPVIIVGLFMTHDPDFEVWATHLRQFLKSASGVIVMHYPTHGAVGEMLGKEHQQKTLPISNMATGTGGETIQPNADLLCTHIIQENHRTVSRMVIPLRRKALLKTIVKVLQQTLKSSRPAMASRTSSDGRPTAPIQVITPEERARFSNMHILAAEDNPVAQKLLHKQLSRLGFQVTCVNNGLEAVEAWKSHPVGHFKMAFFDHHMPKCDGLESTKRIRKIESEDDRTEAMPIVALTADIQDSARQNCVNAGMNEYLTKPMNHALLTEVIRRYCGEPQAPR
ncbi:hypothetical protein BJV82DRAFT_631487 [Fennellomyces sp. T-0311]|nr:hypothetical protein BJV82DRAFT_631487 [Fennellomyces sp. T-0311]